MDERKEVHELTGECFSTRKTWNGWTSFRSGNDEGFKKLRADIQSLVEPFGLTLQEKSKGLIYKNVRGHHVIISSMDTENNEVKWR